MMSRKHKGKAILARRIKAFVNKDGTKKPGSQNAKKSHSGGRRK